MSLSFNTLFSVETEALLMGRDNFYEIPYTFTQGLLIINILNTDNLNQVDMGYIIPYSILGNSQLDYDYIKVYNGNRLLQINKIDATYKLKFKPKYNGRYFIRIDEVISQIDNNISPSDLATTETNILTALDTSFNTLNDSFFLTYNDIQNELNNKQDTLTNPITGTGNNSNFAFFNATNTITGSNLMKAEIYSSGGYNYPRITLGGNINNSFVSRIQMIKDPASNVATLNIDSGSQITYFTGYAHQFNSSQVSLNSGTYLVYGNQWITGKFTPQSWMESYAIYDYRSMILHTSGSSSAYLNFSVNSSVGSQKSQIYITSNGVRIGASGSSTAQLEVLNQDSSKIPIKVFGAYQQSVDNQQWLDSLGNVKCAVDKMGGIRPCAMNDADALNDSIYKSITQGNKLVYKDTDGNINVLY